jgi:hypothetical protein
VVRAKVQNVVCFRHTDARYPFLWEGERQPSARWHGIGDGPVQYLADTPNGAWAEFIRHEEITDTEDLATVRRAIWAIEVGSLPDARPALPQATLTGGLESYEACRQEARRLRRKGVRGLVSASAALLPGGASGWRVDNGVQEAAPEDGKTIVLFGRRPDAIGWPATLAGQPPANLLQRVRPLRKGRRPR